MAVPSHKEIRQFWEFCKELIHLILNKQMSAISQGIEILLNI